jgi:hypothetical protein
MYVKARIRVYINGNYVRNIISVTTENNSRNIGASCELEIPLNSRFLSDKLDEQQKHLFNASDHVEVFVKYDGRETDVNAKVLPDAVTDEEKKNKYLKIFSGFVYSFTLGTPFKVKCIDYTYWMNLAFFGNDEIKIVKTRKMKDGTTKPVVDKNGKQVLERAGVGRQWTGKVFFHEILTELVNWGNIQIGLFNQTISEEGGTNFVPAIELRGLKKDTPEIFEMTLENISFIGMTPAAVLEHFRKELGLVITFLDNELYVNIAGIKDSGLKFGEVKLRTDTNVISSNLQTNNVTDRRKRTSKGALSVFNRINVKAYFIKENGVQESITTGDPMGETREVFYYNVKNKTQEQKIKIAEDALEKFRQETYGGEVETLLYPYFDLFWLVRYKDVRYHDRNGNFVCINIKYKIDESGFHKTAMLSYLENEPEGQAW